MAGCKYQLHQCFRCSLRLIGGSKRSLGEYRDPSFNVSSRSRGSLAHGLEASGAGQEACASLSGRSGAAPLQFYSEAHCVVCGSDV